MSRSDLPARRATLEHAQRTAPARVHRTATHTQLLADSRSANTWRAYVQDLRAWAAYLAERDGLTVDLLTEPAITPADSLEDDGTAAPVPAYLALGRRVLPVVAELAAGETDSSIAAWVSAQVDAGIAAATIRRRLESVTTAYREAWGIGEPPTRGPETRTVVKGLRRRVGRASVGDTVLGRGGARALTRSELYAITDALTGIVGDLEPGYVVALPVRGADRARIVRAARDRALLLVAFAGGLRRSEVVGLEARDLTAMPHGYVLTLRDAKTAKDGEAQTVAIYHAGAAEAIRHGHPTRAGRVDRCPVAALTAWLELAGNPSGAVFPRVNRGGRIVMQSRTVRTGEGAERVEAYAVPLTGHSVRAVILERAQAAGVDTDGLSPHSLRVGMITAAAEQDVPLQRIATQSRHTSLEIVRDYVRHSDTVAAGTAVL